MKKVLFAALMATLLVCAFALIVGAQPAYIEAMPSDLQLDGDPAQYFVVFEGEEYYSGTSSINGLNGTAIQAELDRLGVTLGSTHLAKYIFPEKMGETTVTKIDFNGGIKQNGSYFKGKCGAVVLPSTTNTVTDLNECAGQLRLFDFGKDNSISILSEYFLGSASKLTRMENFPAHLKEIQNSAFRRCTGLKGELYINAETIRYKAFDNGIGLGVTGIVFGPDVKNIEGEAFSTREFSGSANVKYIEFQCDVTQLNIVKSGTNVGVFYFADGSQRNPYSSLACIILSNPAQAGCDGKTFQDYVPSVYFNSTSMNGGNPVYSTHSYGEKAVSYANFFANGTMSATCQRCAKSESGTALDPIFKSLGYSCNVAGAPSITFGIKIDYEALDFYNSSVAIDKQITEYGVLAASGSLAGGSAFDAEMAPKAGVVSVNLMAMAVKNMWADIKIVGLAGEANGVAYDYTDTALFCTAYIVVGTDVVYFDNGAQTTTLNTSISYSSIVENN